MRIFLSALLIALSAYGAALAADLPQQPTSGVAPLASTPPKAQDFNQYVRLLLASHPEVLALKAEAEAKGNMPSQEYSLPNPQLSIGVMDLPSDSLSFTSEDMTRKSIGISQAFPASGKRELRRKVAQDDADMAAHAVGEKRLELVESARLAFYELRYLLKVQATVVKNKKVLHEFIDIALAKYTVGGGVQQDVLAAQLEYSKTAEYLIGIEQRLATLSRNLNVWAGLPPETDWSDPSVMPLGEILAAEDKMVEGAVGKRPLFRQMGAALQKAEDAAALARRELAPDYAVKFSYSQRDDTPMQRSDLFSAEVMFDLPLYRKTKQDKMIAQSMIMADRARLDIEAEKLKLRRDIAELMEMQRKNMRLLALYQTGLLPQAEQAVHAAMSAYRVNKVDFRWLVMNQVTLFNYQIQMDQVEFDLQSTRTKLLRAMGEENNSEVANGY